MTTTDLTTARRDVARKRAANAVSRRNTHKVIDGEARPTRNHRAEAFRGIAYLVMGLLFAGFVLSLLAYYS